MSAHFAKWLFAISLLILFQGNNGQLNRYVPPTPTIEPLQPRGLRISIPHEDGISLVAYHVKFNEDFDGLEAGVIARDIVKTRNGRWTYEDRTTRLRKDDVIYYWIHVVYDGLGYNLVGKRYVVKEFYNYGGGVVNKGGTAAGCSTYSETRVYNIDKDTIQLTPYDVCPNQLIFEENFDTLNTSRWTIIERFSGPPSYEFVAYLNSEDTVVVKNGALHIKPVLTEHKYGEGFVRSGSLTLDKCTETIGSESCRRSAVGPFILPPVLTGRMNTKQSFAFMYGRVQMRVKLPRGDWIYPILSMESMENRTKDTKGFNSIVLAYTVGNPELTNADGKDISGHVLFSGAHVVNLTQLNSQYSNRAHLPVTTSNTLWSDDYHVFDLVWTNRELTVSIDGVLFGQQNLPTWYNTPFYMNVGLAVGGLTYFRDNIRSGNVMKPWRNVESKAVYNFYNARDVWLETWQQSDTSLHVDYIKIWAI